MWSYYLFCIGKWCRVYYNSGKRNYWGWGIYLKRWVVYSLRRVRFYCISRKE